MPEAERKKIRLQLSLVLEGVVSQRLLPRKNDGSRVPAVEIMLATPTIRDMLSEGKTLELHKAIYEGMHYYGTQTFQQSIYATTHQKVLLLSPLATSIERHILPPQTAAT